MTSNTSRLLVASVASLMASACDSLDPVATGVCGNLVVEAGEQCDGAENCGREAAAACRFTCEPGEVACPGDFACSAEGVCVASAGPFIDPSSASRFELPVDRLVAGDLDGDLRADLVGVGTSARVRFGSSTDPLLASYEKPIRPPTGAAAFGELDDVAGLDVVIPTADGVFILVARGRELEAIPFARTSALPNDGGSNCDLPWPLGWDACKRGDFNRDGMLDRAGFTLDRDNILVELGRATEGYTAVTLDTNDVITDLATGDFDADGYSDIAVTTRSVDGVFAATAHVVFGAPQANTFQLAPIATADAYEGLATADTDLDGVTDLALSRGGDVAVYLGSASRDLSAPFRLKPTDRSGTDIPFAVVAGEFVGGPGSGIDVMAYARNEAEPDAAYFWWLRGTGNAQLSFPIVDRVPTNALGFLDEQWRVADVLEEASDANGPDEVVGLSPSAAGCRGPALSAALPSARDTTVELLQRACLDVPGEGWVPELVGLTAIGEQPLAFARRGDDWWLGDRADLGASLESGALSGATFELPGTCRDAQLWPEVRGGQTTVSWLCDSAGATDIVALRLAPSGEYTVETLGPAMSTASHLVGDFNGDGLTDVVLRDGRFVELRLQCSVDMVGQTPGC